MSKKIKKHLTDSQVQQVLLETVETCDIDVLLELFKVAFPETSISEIPLGSNEPDYIVELSEDALSHLGKIFQDAPVVDLEIK